ncbi:Rrf2 family transcriptional regulator [Clostridium sporogenes]|uniref:Rrf2 family transcriptional regulator n=1 Tax=Clostridium sporogenes TaxID=1509 RepID=UPI002149E8B4|nr:Rrf2 family transcriptional regulator [Clostridium sporogenes]MCR1975432.1 Rrf2 family transcriptional regulator [Clostridium sporogenes]
MRISTKFPIAVHSLIMIAALSDKKKITSEVISESTGVNAVIIRNIFKSLKQANMISVSPGPGGTTLARNPDSITLWDILTAVELMETDDVFKFHQRVRENCPIGGNIYVLLKTHLDSSVDALKNELSSVTLSMIVNELYNLMPDLPPMPKQD